MIDESRQSPYMPWSRSFPVGFLPKSAAFNLLFEIPYPNIEFQPRKERTW
jgi:hypothetical protein